MQKVAVIIATYQAEPWLRACLNSVLCSNTAISIYVVDNASTDATVEIIQREYGGKVRLHCHPVNAGFGMANNIAIKQAYLDGYDYFLLLNQDCYITSEAIENLIHQMHKEKAFDIVSPIHLNGSGNSLDGGFEAHLHERYTPEFLNIYKSKKYENRVYPVMFVNAACWLVSRKCIEEIGLFNPLFFHYGEDRNYVQRLHFHGLKIGVYPFISIIHDRTSTSHESRLKEPFHRKKHNLLLIFADPSNDYAVLNHILFMVVKSIKALFRFDFHQSLHVWESANVLINLNLIKVIRVRRLTAKKGNSFFNHTPAFQTTSIFKIL